MSKPKNPLMVEPRTKIVEILDGAAEAEIAALDTEFNAAVDADNGPDRRMSSVPQADAIAETIDQRVEEIYAAAVKVKLREPSRAEVAEARDDNPPTEGNERQELAGIDEVGFIRQLVQVCLVEPDVTDEQFDEWWTSLSEFNYRELKKTIDEFATRGPSIPKSSAVSALAETRRRASKQRSATA